MNGNGNRILEKMVAVWNIPRDQRPPPRAMDVDYVQSELSAAAVHQVLLKEFTETAIRTAVVELLERIGDCYEHGVVPSRLDRFLCQCCLGLASREGGVEVPKGLVQRLVRSLPTPGWYYPVGHLVRDYLTRSELLEALLSGLT